MMSELTQEIKDGTLEAIRNVHTMVPGRIISFNPDKCEASVLPYGRYKKPDGSVIPYPQINEVPVYVMQGSAQTATFVYPVISGDECLILFAEQALDAWRKKTEPKTDLKFDLSNAVAIVGLMSKPNPLIKEACSDNAVIVEKDGERIRLKKGETYIMDTAGQSITLTPDAVAVIGNKITMQSQSSIDLTAAVSVTLSALAISLSAQSVNMSAGGGIGMSMSASGVTVQGDVDVTGDVKAEGISLKGHRHGGVQGGSGMTGTPQ